MNANLRRFDISPYLIHFFRKIDSTGGNCPVFPEHWGFGNLEPETTYPPLFLLRCAIRQTKIWATWSYRNGIRTIYGSSPAVCFTEMPIAAFLESGAARQARGEHMSTYALVFPKTSLYARGARPVIYGLSDPEGPLPSKGSGGPRIIDANILPLNEQYRYVTYSPSVQGGVDWTHEREWRWPYREETSDFDNHIVDYGTGPEVDLYPGLDFSGFDLHGIGVIVKTAKEGALISYDILFQVDRGALRKTQFDFILCTDNLPEVRDLRDPQEVAEAVEAAAIDLSPYFSISDKKASSLTEEFSSLASEIEDGAENPKAGELGGCWLWFSDNTHELTRALLKEERIIVSNEGRYLVKIYEFDDSRSLSQRESMTKKLAKKVVKKYDLKCTYFSTLGHDDPNGVPFYTDPDFSWPFFNDGMNDPNESEDE